jgi:hypothetical protein
MMENTEEKLATQVTQDKEKKQKQKQKTPTQCALDTTIRKQTQTTSIRQDPS